MGLAREARIRPKGSCRLKKESGLFVKPWGIHSRVLSRDDHDLLVLLDDSGNCEENRLKKRKSKSRETGRGTISRVQARKGVP